MAFTAKIQVVCSKEGLPRGGHGHPRTPPSYAPVSPATRILNENPPFFIFCTKESAPYKFIECTTVLSSFFIIRQVKPKPGKNTSLKKFHSQYYVNGSECDLTGKARETQIKVFCIMTVLTAISTYIFSRLIVHTFPKELVKRIVLKIKRFSLL